MLVLKHRNINITKESYNNSYRFQGINNIETSDSIEGIISKVDNNFNYAYQHIVIGSKPVEEVILNSNKEVEIEVRNNEIIISNGELKQVIKHCSVKIEALIESYKKIGFEPISDVEHNNNISTVKGKFFFDKEVHLSLKNRIEGYKSLINKKVTIAYFDYDLGNIETITILNPSLEEIFLLKITIDMSFCSDSEEFRIYEFILKHESQDIGNNELQKLINRQLDNSQDDTTTFYKIIIH